MSVMIYDNTSKAFKNIQAMQRYDSSANAWKECTSAQVQENGVWTEKMQKTVEPISISFTNASDISGFVCSAGLASGECIACNSNGAFVVVKGNSERSLAYKKNLEKIITIPLNSKCELGFSLWLQPGSSSCLGAASFSLYNGDSHIVHAYIDDAWASYDIQCNGVLIFGEQVYYKEQNPSGGGVASADCKFVFDNGTLDTYFAGVKVATKSYTSDIVIDTMYISGRSYYGNQRLGYVKNFYIK